MKLPIFDIGEMNDILIFESKELAENYIEPIDLINGDVRLLDSEGRLLDAVPHPKLNSIIINDNDSKATHSKELKNQIIKFLTIVDDCIDKDNLRDKSLDSLVQMTLKYKIN